MPGRPVPHAKKWFLIRLDGKVIVSNQACLSGETSQTGAPGQILMRYAGDERPARAGFLIASRKTTEKSRDLTELPSDVRNQRTTVSRSEERE